MSQDGRPLVLVASEGKVNPPALYSLLSKLLWFHHPDRAFMYDSFVAKVVIIKENTNHMSLLESRFLASEAEIKKASKYFLVPIRIQGELSTNISGWMVITMKNNKY